jgi:predicted nucleotidyltransferase
MNFVQDPKSDFGLIPIDFKLIADVISRFPVDEVYIFGSRAKGTHKHGSDVDLALKGPKLTEQDVARIHYLLNEETIMPYFFDVVLWDEHLDSSLKQHLERAARKLFE